MDANRSSAVTRPLPPEVADGRALVDVRVAAQAPKGPP